MRRKSTRPARTSRSSQGEIDGWPSISPWESPSCQSLTTYQIGTSRHPSTSRCIDMASFRLTEQEILDLLLVLRDSQSQNALPTSLNELLLNLEVSAIVDVPGTTALATPPQTPFSSMSFVPPGLPPLPSLLSPIQEISSFNFDHVTSERDHSLELHDASDDPSVSPNHEPDLTSPDTNSTVSNPSLESSTAGKGKGKGRKKRRGRLLVRAGEGGAPPPGGGYGDPEVAYWPDCERGGVLVAAVEGVQVAQHSYAAAATWEESETTSHTTTVPTATILSSMAMASLSDLNNPATQEWISSLESLVKGDAWSDAPNAFLDNSVGSIVSRCQRSIAMNIGLELVMMVNFIQLAAKVDRYVFLFLFTFKMSNVSHLL